MSKMIVVVDDEVKEVVKVHTYGYLPVLECDDGTEYHIAENPDEAGEKVVERWEEMADKDPGELRALVGDEVLVQWAMGHSAGPGGLQACSLSEWIEGIADYPEEEFASYDGEERDGFINRNLADELGWNYPSSGKIECVLYRCQ